MFVIFKQSTSGGVGGGGGGYLRNGTVKLSYPVPELFQQNFAALLYFNKLISFLESYHLF